MKYRHIGILSLGHLATDINQGALPAMLPFFIVAYDLTYAAAAGIVFAANMTSSLVQPLFGYAADRFSKPWLLSAGPMLAGVGLGLSGMFLSYQWILFNMSAGDHLITIIAEDENGHTASRDFEFTVNSDDYNPQIASVQIFGQDASGADGRVMDSK